MVTPEMTLCYGQTGNDLVVGGGGNDLTFGQTGDDTLSGNFGGTDTLLGGAGNDTYELDNSPDMVIEAAGEGVDVVRTIWNCTLAENVENLVLVYGNISGTGNAMANVITGNAGSNSIDGGLGNDTMAGGDGNDIYHVNSLLDVVVEDAPCLQWRGYGFRIGKRVYPRDECGKPGAGRVRRQWDRQYPGQPRLWQCPEQQSQRRDRQ